MNRLIVLLLALPISAADFDSAREMGLRDVRVINGVLYDFGAAPASCVVSGTVKRIVPKKGVVLSNWYTRMEVGEIPNYETGTAGQLREMINRQLYSSPGARLAAGAPVRYIDYEVETAVANVTAEIGQKVRVIGLKAPDGFWDAGVKFTGNLHDFKTLHSVTMRGIAAIPIPSREDLEARAEARDKSALEKLARNATNGFPTCQYELGVRYQKGDGVPVDFELAREWLGKAAAQGHAKAKAALENLTVPPSPK